MSDDSVPPRGGIFPPLRGIAFHGSSKRTEQVGLARKRTRSSGVGSAFRRPYWANRYFEFSLEVKSSLRTPENGGRRIGNSLRRSVGVLGIRVRRLASRRPIELCSTDCPPLHTATLSGTLLFHSMILRHNPAKIDSARPKTSNILKLREESAKFYIEDLRKTVRLDGFHAESTMICYDRCHFVETSGSNFDNFRCFSAKISNTDRLQPIVS